MSSNSTDAAHSMEGRGTGARPEGRAPSAAAPELHDLMADVQDLLSQLAHVADPDIARLRARVTETLVTARQTVAGGAAQARRQARDTLRAGDNYVRTQPWQAVGIAAAAGILVGFIFGKR